MCIISYLISCLIVLPFIYVFIREAIEKNKYGSETNTEIAIASSTLAIITALCWPLVLSMLVTTFVMDWIYYKVINKDNKQ